MLWKYAAIPALALGTPAFCNEAYEWRYDLLHSELPLYNFDDPDFWPRSYTGPDVVAGCESRVRFGEWEFTPNPDDEFGRPAWYRFTNYGVFHCAANIQTANQRDALDSGDFSRGFFARIGRASKGGEEVELWILQQGLIPGSEYLLLFKPVDGEGIVQEFGVLQSRCPGSWLRKSGNFDIWATGYCAINDRSDLLRFARRMLKEPELGRLSLVPTDNRPETKASDPTKGSEEG